MLTNERLNPQFIRAHGYRLTDAQVLVVFCVTVLILLFAMHYRLGMELADDGAFFLRYAENMVKGEFWVWNLGEAPVWGASAPLYPLIIALPMALGVSPESAIVGVGLALASASLAAVTLMLGHRFGFITAFGFLAFLTLATSMMYFSGAGLETPLTIALLASALWTLLYKPNGWVIGLIAGLIIVNKLDLVPVGGLLILAHWIQDKRFPRVAIIVALVIGSAWYGFAWWYFGAPVPNSFLTKSLHQSSQPKTIDWTWFGMFLFWAGVHKWFTGLSAFAVWHRGRELLPLVVLLGGTLMVHLIAYTVKFPFEPYNWYAMPALFSLVVGAAIGLGVLSEVVSRLVSAKSLAAGTVAVLVLGLVFITSIEEEKIATNHIKMFASHHEFDRAEAGRWVDANTPENFVVYTMWGNPAYYSQRRVLDGSFLNRKFEELDLITKYRPEILILQNNPGSTPMAPVFAATTGEDYRVVKVFDKTHSAGMDYFFVVLARQDVLDSIRYIDPPRDLMAFVGDVVLGDQFGILRPQGLGTLFVHPGATTVTSFKFAAADYLRHGEEQVIHIHARISPNISEEAVRRGAGNVRVRILQGENQLADETVSVGKPLHRNIPISDDEGLQFIVDNNGGADTDWLLLSIK